MIGALCGLLLAAEPARNDAAAFQAYAASLTVETHPEPAYHYAAEVYRTIAAEQAVRSGTITPVRIGESLDHRPLWAFSVRDPAVAPTRRLVLIANIHAMEWVPTEDALAFLQAAAEAPVPGVELVVVPIVNPDGRARVEADLLAGRNVYRRGNQQQVDLNRDWTVNRESRAVWRHLLPGRYTTSPEPLSQPETRALEALLHAPGPQLAGFVSLHSFGGFIYYPWAGDFARAPDHAGLQRIAEAMQAGMGAHAYRPRQLSRWGFFFRGLGMELDHVYGTLHAPAFLVETTRSGIERPADLKTYFRWYNPRDPARHIRAGVGMLRAWVTATTSYNE